MNDLGLLSRMMGGSQNKSLWCVDPNEFHFKCGGENVWFIYSYVCELVASFRYNDYDYRTEFQ